MNKKILSTGINMLGKTINAIGGGVWALAKSILRFILIPEIVNILLIKTFTFFNELGDIIYEIMKNSQNPYIQKSLKCVEASIMPYLISFGLVSPYDEWSKDKAIHNYHDEYRHLHPWKKMLCV